MSAQVDGGLGNCVKRLQTWGARTPIGLSVNFKYLIISKILVTHFILTKGNRLVEENPKT